MSLRDALLGAWELESFTTTRETSGHVEHPLGPAPQGLIIYTPDGHMSAQLADSGMSGYIAYGGRFEVDEQTSTLHHQVTISMMPELLAQRQFRHARIEADALVLSATSTDDDGPSHSVLVWRRAAKD